MEKAETRIIGNQKKMDNQKLELNTTKRRWITRNYTVIKAFSDLEIVLFIASKSSGYS